MNKATPSVNIPDLARENVTTAGGAEAAPAAASDFVNFFTSHISGRGGGPLAASAINNALLPLWVRYERGRFRFNLTENVAGLTDATIGIWGWTPEEIPVFLGEVSLNASGQFDPFEFDIEPGMTYAVRVTAIAGAGADITVGVLAQAYNTYLNLN